MDRPSLESDQKNVVIDEDAPIDYYLHEQREECRRQRRRMERQSSSSDGNVDEPNFGTIIRTAIEISAVPIDERLDLSQCSNFSLASTPPRVEAESYPNATNGGRSKVNDGSAEEERQSKAELSDDMSIKAHKSDLLVNQEKPTEAASSSRVVDWLAQSPAFPRGNGKTDSNRQMSNCSVNEFSDFEVMMESFDVNEMMEAEMMSTTSYERVKRRSSFGLKDKEEHSQSDLSSEDDENSVKSEDVRSYFSPIQLSRLKSAELNDLTSTPKTSHPITAANDKNAPPRPANRLMPPTGFHPSKRSAESSSSSSVAPSESTATSGATRASAPLKSHVQNAAWLHPSLRLSETSTIDNFEKFKSGIVDENAEITDDIVTAGSSGTSKEFTKATIPYVDSFTGSKFHDTKNGTPSTDKRKVNQSAKLNKDSNDDDKRFKAPKLKKAPTQRAARSSSAMPKPIAATTSTDGTISGTNSRNVFNCTNRSEVSIVSCEDLYEERAAVNWYRDHLVTPTTVRNSEAKPPDDWEELRLRAFSSRTARLPHRTDVGVLDYHNDSRFLINDCLLDLKQPVGGTVGEYLRNHPNAVLSRIVSVSADTSTNTSYSTTTAKMTTKSEEGTPFPPKRKRGRKPMMLRVPVANRDKLVLPISTNARLYFSPRQPLEFVFEETGTDESSRQGPASGVLTGGRIAAKNADGTKETDSVLSRDINYTETIDISMALEDSSIRGAVPQGGRRQPTHKHAAYPVMREINNLLVDAGVRRPVRRRRRRSKSCSTERMEVSAEEPIKKAANRIVDPASLEPSLEDVLQTRFCRIPWERLESIKRPNAPEPSHHERTDGPMVLDGTSTKRPALEISTEMDARLTGITTNVPSEEAFGFYDDMLRQVQRNPPDVGDYFDMPDHSPEYAPDYGDRVPVSSATTMTAAASVAGATTTTAANPENSMMMTTHFFDNTTRTMPRATASTPLISGKLPPAHTRPASVLSLSTIHAGTTSSDGSQRLSSGASDSANTSNESGNINHNNNNENNKIEYVDRRELIELEKRLTAGFDKRINALIDEMQSGLRGIRGLLGAILPPSHDGAPASPAANLATSKLADQSALLESRRLEEKSRQTETNTVPAVQHTKIVPSKDERTDAEFLAARRNRLMGNPNYFDSSSSFSDSVEVIPTISAAPMTKPAISTTNSAASKMSTVLTTTAPSGKSTTETTISTEATTIARKSKNADTSEDTTPEISFNSYVPRTKPLRMPVAVSPITIQDNGNSDVDIFDIGTDDLEALERQRTAEALRPREAKPELSEEKEEVPKKETPAGPSTSMASRNVERKASTTAVSRTKISVSKIGPMRGLKSGSKRADDNDAIQFLERFKDEMMAGMEAWPPIPSAVKSSRKRAATTPSPPPARVRLDDDAWDETGFAPDEDLCPPMLSPMGRRARQMRQRSSKSPG